MKPEIKKQWVEALRSGAYKQGRQLLKSGDEYCCLGVLCDLAIKAGVEVKAVDSTINGKLCTLFDDDRAVLPASVIQWSGLASQNPEIYLEGRESASSLAALNDGRSADNIFDLPAVIPHDFNQIADIIEQKL